MAEEDSEEMAKRSCSRGALTSEAASAATALYNDTVTPDVVVPTLPAGVMDTQPLPLAFTLKYCSCHPMVPVPAVKYAPTLAGIQPHVDTLKAMPLASVT